MYESKREGDKERDITYVNFRIFLIFRAPIFDSVDKYTKNPILVEWIRTHYAEEYSQRLSEVGEW